MHNQYLVTFLVLLLVSFAVGMCGRLIKIPYTIALVIAGLALGLLQILPDARLDPTILFTVFLPPLLFEGGLNIKLHALRRDWLLVLLLSVVGTVVAMLTAGIAAIWLLGLPLLVALLLGAIVAPTDPIAVLALFRKSGMNERLTMIVESESLFNDGVAVVLFVVISQALATGNISVPACIALFARNALGGITVGIGIGWLVSRLLGKTRDHLLATMLTTLAAYGAYLCAESMHTSGVIAVVAASLCVGNYGISKRLSDEAYTAVMIFWEYAAFVVNSIVFLLVGIEAAAILQPTVWHILLCGAAIMLCGRACSVYALCGLKGLFARVVPASWQHMLVWSGLRGALSMAMVLGVDANAPYRDIMLTLTFGAVLFSLLVQGLTIAPLIKQLKLGR